MNNSLLTFDTLQTLTRAVLKIGGGFLLAKGVADESTLEALTAGALALVAVVWGIKHRSATKLPDVKAITLPLLVIAPLLCFGCASANTVAFRTEKLATDAAYAGLISWKAYYAAALTNSAPERLGKLSERNEEIFAASRQFAATVAIADAIRESCATNAAASNRTALELALVATQSHSSNLVWLVKSYLKP